MMARHFFVGWTVAVAAWTTGYAAADDPAALRPWAANPWYWSFHDQPVLLLGGSDDDNLFQWPEQELIPQLNRIVAAGGNVIRNTMSDRKDRGFEVYAFLRLENGKYDLSRWNPEYWERFERLLRETAKRKIFVQIEIWDRFDYTDNRQDDPRRWQDHPYCPANNINYSFEESGFAKRYPDHPGANKQPFFFTTPKQRNNQVVLRFQQQFVNKLLDHSLKYDHVLYCMDNETRAEPEWASYWAHFVKSRAAQAGKGVMTTEMWDDWNLQASAIARLSIIPSSMTSSNVSQNNHNQGEKHWDNFLFVRELLSSAPRPMNTTKTYGANGNKFGHSDQDAIERFWRHLLAGAASIRFHRPDSGLGINDKAVACIRAARLLERETPLWNLEADNSLLLDRQANEAYCAASKAREIRVVFFPLAESNREVSLKPSADSGELAIRWLNIDLGQWASPGETKSGAVLRLKPPRKANMAVLIVGGSQRSNAR